MHDALELETYLTEPDFLLLNTQERALFPDSDIGKVSTHPWYLGLKFIINQYYIINVYMKDVIPSKSSWAATYGPPSYLSATIMTIWIFNEGIPVQHQARCQCPG